MTHPTVQKSSDRTSKGEWLAWERSALIPEPSSSSRLRQPLILACSLPHKKPHCPDRALIEAYNEHTQPGGHCCELSSHTTVPLETVLQNGYNARECVYAWMVPCIFKCQTYTSIFNAFAVETIGSSYCSQEKEAKSPGSWNSWSFHSVHLRIKDQSRVIMCGVCRINLQDRLCKGMTIPNQYINHAERNGVNMVNINTFKSGIIQAENRPKQWMLHWGCIFSLSQWAYGTLCQ